MVQLPGPPLPTRGPVQPAPPEAHDYLAFPEGRRGRERGWGVPACCCCPRSPLQAPSLPDRKPAPIPSQLQPAPRPPPPLQAHGVTLRSLARSLGGPAGPCGSAPAPRRWPLKAGLIPGAAPALRPLLLVRGPRPLLPHAGATRGPRAELLGVRGCPQCHQLLTQRQPGTLGQGCERAFVLGRQDRGLESQAEREGAGSQAHLT